MIFGIKTELFEGQPEEFEPIAVSLGIFGRIHVIQEGL